MTAVPVEATIACCELRLEQLQCGDLTTSWYGTAHASQAWVRG